MKNLLPVIICVLSCCGLKSYAQVRISTEAGIQTYYNPVPVVSMTDTAGERILSPYNPINSTTQKGQQTILNNVPDDRKTKEDTNRKVVSHKAESEATKPTEVKPE